MTENQLVRFFKKIVESGECWEWTGLLNEKGYGRLTLDRKGHKAHRLSYEIFRGAIPEGLTIDHLCKKRNCVNPFHMEIVTQAVNALRGDSYVAKKARQTHCLKGHELSLSQSPSQMGRRTCKTCKRDYKRNWYRRMAKQKLEGFFL